VGAGLRLRWLGDGPGDPYLGHRGCVHPRVSDAEARHQSVESDKSEVKYPISPLLACGRDSTDERDVVVSVHLHGALRYIFGSVLSLDVPQPKRRYDACH
jgi:hypothetical protein